MFVVWWCVSSLCFGVVWCGLGDVGDCELFCKPDADRKGGVCESDKWLRTACDKCRIETKVEKPEVDIRTEK